MVNRDSSNLEDTKIEEMANSIFSRLEESDLQFIRLHPSTTSMNYGFGLYIRNKYVDDANAHPECTSKDDSSKIMSLIMAKALPEYDQYPLALELTEFSDLLLHSVHSYGFTKNPEQYMSVVGKFYPEYSAELARIDEEFETVSKTDLVSALQNHAIAEKRADSKFSSSIAKDMFESSPAIIQLRDKCAAEANNSEAADAEDSLGQRLQEFTQTWESYAKGCGDAAPMFLPPSTAILADTSYKGSEQWNEAVADLQWFFDNVSIPSGSVELPEWMTVYQDVALSE